MALLSICLLVFLILIVEPMRIIESIRHADGWLCLLGFLLTPVVQSFKIAKWHNLANIVTPVSLWQAIRSYMYGVVLATITPGQAGEAARAMFLTNVNKARLTGKVIVDKLIDLSAVGLLSGIGLLVLEDVHLQWLGWLLLAGVPCGWISLCFLGRFTTKSKAQAEGVKAKLAEVWVGLSDTKAKPILLNLLLSFASFAVYYFQGFLILKSFAPGAEILAILALPVMTLSTIVPIAFSGIGIRESTAVFLLGALGIEQAAAFNASLIHFTLVQIVPVLLWLVIFRLPGASKTVTE